MTKEEIKQLFENTLNKKMFNEIYKHDYQDSSHLINPYLIDTQKLIKLTNNIRKGNKNYDER